MKIRFYSFLLIVSCSQYLYSQVGIGTQNPQHTVHIDAQLNNDTSNANSRYYDDVVITSDGKLGVGTVNPVTKVDVRNETFNNAVAIGKTNQTAAQAGAGAVQYFSNATNSGLHYSDGNNWIPINSKPINSLVYATKSSSQAVNTNSVTSISNWNEVTDENQNFDPTTGIFTAPRTGVYVVTLNLATESGSITNNSRIEVIINSNTTNGVPEFRCLNSYPGFSTGTATNIASGSCTAIFYLNQNQTISPRFYQNISTGSRNIIADSSYNTLTIYGL